MLQPDVTREYDLPERNYRDIAYDCTTFPVPVVWAANRFGACELIAFEVATTAPCLQSEPPARILRAALQRATERSARLPLVTATADRVFSGPTPLSARWTTSTPSSTPSIPS